MKDRISLAEHKEKFTGTLKQGTLCFLVKDGEVLLAMKKRGFAEGKWNGAGGKMDERDSNIEQAAIRETYEEIEVVPKSLEKVAVLNFYHLSQEDGGMQVTAYICTEWEGTPTESEEMRPEWFAFDEVPYEDMWENDRDWIPMVLKGKKVEADFLFDENQKLIDQEIVEIE